MNTTIENILYKAESIAGWTAFIFGAIALTLFVDQNWTTWVGKDIADILTNGFLN